MSSPAALPPTLHGKFGRREIFGSVGVTYSQKNQKYRPLTEVPGPRVFHLHHSQQRDDESGLRLRGWTLCGSSTVDYPARQAGWLAQLPKTSK